jgi:hypothetical protein
MPNAYALTTIVPKPELESTAIKSVIEAKSIVSKHDPLAVAWRTAIGGPSSGHLHLSMGWDSCEAMGRATDALAADPVYRAFVATNQELNALSTLRQTIAGSDIPGLETPRLPAFNGKSRAAMAVMYPRAEQTLELVASAKELFESEGVTWFGRMWSIGLPGTGSVLVSYSVFPDQPSLGKFIDMQRASDKHRALLTKATPLIVGRRWLTELPG